LSSEIIQLLGEAENIAHFEAIIANSHWSLFRQRFPAFSDFKIHDLHLKAQSIIDAEKKESTLFANTILLQVQQRFQGFQKILNTPARQLSEEEKAQKTRLRKGKSLLVKEFAKTRSHPSVRELFASEAREWIQLLLPIWFSNPTQVSKTFPLNQDLFDVAIFDEARQIPLQNGLGALQRANHGIIAGDSQQMGPTSYFKSGVSDIVDLLHQASFHWQSCSLKHHYRSLHPNLVAFSNKHFYKGELTAYPANGITNPIEYHFISEGRFIDRKNEVEAKAIASEIEIRLKEESSLGIVAFSEEQLGCIRNQLSARSEKRLTERLEDGTAFFKSVENVQGDECDHLLISFGYGKDAEGNFAMRFGPMNTENGRRRLNVLLTRARKRLDFFTSVSYSDFKLSDNESIDLLRLWFAALTSTSQNKETMLLPFEADFEVNEDELKLKRPHAHFSKAPELVTFQSVMEARGWNLQYQ
jgi:superfamily I DNA and/or RNA helicase